MNQRTIARAVSCSGVGIHTGVHATVNFKPAEENTGVVFVRTDIESQPRIPARVEHVTSVNRGTTITNDGARVYTVEHVLAAVAGLGIDNLIIELDGIEAPAGDGSSQVFVKALEKAGFVEQEAGKKIAVLTEPFSFEDNGVHFLLLPNDTFKISFHIEYPNPLVGCQFDSIEINPDSFRKYIANARTFAFLEDVEDLKRAGLIKGGSLENAVVIAKDRILNDDPLRSPKELVRHKMLDLLGDVFLLGMPIRAHIIASKSGHPSNIALVRKLREHLARQRPAVMTTISDAASKPVTGQDKEDVLLGMFRERGMVMNIRDIMEKIPHRYPFLLVDRIVQFEAEKRVVGLKNVSMNEHFFQGHFPDHPIMPGVLIVEAMGQTGGLLLMNSVPEPENKVMYFMSLDNIKFRKPVFPGDQLRMELEMVKFRHRICKMRGRGFVGEDLVAEAEMTAVVVDKDRLPD